MDHSKPGEDNSSCLYEYPLFKLTKCDRWALLVAKRRIEVENSPVFHQRPYLIDALPSWANSTRHKLLKALEGHPTLESWMHERMKGEVIKSYSNCRLPTMYYNRMEWLNRLLNYKSPNLIERVVVNMYNYLWRVMYSI